MSTMADNILEAVICEQFDSVRSLLTADPSSVHSVDAFGDSLLHWAAHRKSLLLVRFLVLHGANVNARNHAGSTPLHKAVLAGSGLIIDFLLENGAEWVANDSGYTPFDYARADRDLFLKLLAFEKTKVADNMSIPFAQLALVIGKKGSMLGMRMAFIQAHSRFMDVDDIRLRTGANVTVPRAGSAEDVGDRVIQIVAKSQLHVDQAKKLISEHLTAKTAAGGVAVVGEVGGKGSDLFSQFSKTINVPKNKHGRLLGKGGKMLADLQERTGTMINIPPSNSRSELVTIVGDPYEVDLAIREITTLVRDTGGPMTERKVRVPHQQHRMIIGKGGETIKRLRDEYSVHISIPPAEKKEDTISIRGNPSDIDSALYEIHTLTQREGGRGQGGERAPRGRGGSRGRGAPRERREEREEVKEEQQPRKKPSQKPINLTDMSSFPSF